MTKRLQIRNQIIEDRLNNSENSWSYNHLSQNLNLTIDIINKYKDEYWNWKYISRNSNITLDIILNNFNLPWDWDYISVNQNITWDNVLNNLQYPWDWEYLSRYKPITWSRIKKNLDLYRQKLHWNVIGYKFDFEILENLGLSVPWNFENLSYFNPIINWDIVIKYKDQDWNWDFLSNSQNLDYNIILDHIYKPWNWDKISLNLKITSPVLSTNYNWNWNILSKNNSITEEILLDHKDKPWNYSKLSSSISKEFVLNNPDKPWDYNKLAANNILIIKDKITDWSMVSEKLPLDFIKENINLFTTNYSWRCITRNENMNFDFILEHKDKPLDWITISYSNYITYENVSDNINLPWDWGALSGNKNMLDIESEFKLKAREHLAAYKIQQTWFKAYYNPEYLICKRRLYNEFENLTKFF
jgi:hypothetical protein